MNITVRQAIRSDTDAVAGLVHALLAELARPGSDSPALEEVTASAHRVLDEGDGVWAFLAVEDGGEALGVVTLNECRAIYAGGRFGEISELYVAPRARSVGIGPKLLDRAIQFAREKQWGRLEVGAPDVPRWNRTVSFYLDNGFTEVGPRLRCLL